MSRKFVNMSAADYHAAEGLSSSAIRCFMQKGNLEFFARYVRKAKKKIEDTDSMRLGRAFHLAMQDPESWKDAYVLMPDCVPDCTLLHQANAMLDAKKSTAQRLRAGDPWNMKYPSHRDLHDAYKAFAESTGKEVLTPDEAQRVENQISAVYDNAQCLEYVGKKSAVNVEIACFQDDPRLPMPKKALIDLLVGDTVVDFKTHHEVNPFDFLRCSERMGYDYQLAHYCGVAGKTQGVLITVSQEDPFESMVFRLPEEKLKRRARELEHQVDRIAQVFDGASFGTSVIDSFGVPADWHNEGWGGELPLDCEEFLQLKREFR